ncbi:MAG TPA: serine hydrolase domain-containing protein [Bacteroidales bacterium]|nr:serine hydrolase domain-containing protein [Bacteroidales bacterium]
MKKIIAAAILIAIAALNNLSGQVPHVKSITRIPDSVLHVLEKKLAEEIPVLMDEAGIPGSAVALIGRDGILWHREYGYASRLKNRKVTEKTLFCLMSCSKSITALGVLTAVREGILDPNEPVSTYVPGLNFKSRFEESPEDSITLRLLLSHRAGFENDVNCGEFGNRPHQIDEYINKITGVWMNFPVGYQPYYSNIGFELAGYILEQKAGIPFSEYMDKKVFGPLGMDHSTYDQERIKTITDRANGSWSREADKNSEPPAYIPMLACGGAYSNLEDMARYIQFHLGSLIPEGELTGDFGMNLMHSLAFPANGQQGGYTTGMERYPLGDTYYLFQEGGGYGFESAIIIYPDLNLGLVLLTNSCWTRLNGSTMAGLINGIIGTSCKADKTEMSGNQTGSYKEKAVYDPALEDIYGIYDTDKKIFRRGDSVFFETGGKDNPLRFYSDSTEIFAVYGSGMRIRFLPKLAGSPGNIQIINLNTGTAAYAFFNKPLPEYDRSGSGKTVWKSLPGRYNLYIDGLYRGRFLVKMDNGYLTVNGSRCHEFHPGMFFNCEGSVFDFTGSVPVIAGFSLTKQMEDARE